MLGFQADTVASVIIQFRKFIYQSKLKICINYISTENMISCSHQTIRRCFDVNEEKCLCLIILFGNYFIYCFFVIAKVCLFCCRLIGAAVDSDDLIVFLPCHCQVTARNHIF